jgi:hypothetical protein
MQLIDDIVPPSNVALDALRIGFTEESATTTLWIGIDEEMITTAAVTLLATDIKRRCIELGAKHFEVEIRATNVVFMSKLLDPADFPLDLARWTDPYCRTIGTPTTSALHPHLLGTASIFLRMAGHSRLCLLTAHHVLNRKWAVDLRLDDVSNRPRVLFSRGKISQTSLVVLKKGAIIELTIGRCSPLQSFLRYQLTWSREIPVIGFGNQKFSEPGDSGSIVVDRSGKLCGLLQGGSEGRDPVIAGNRLEDIVETDVTYCTPMWWVWEKMRDFGLDISLA